MAQGPDAGFVSFRGFLSLVADDMVEEEGRRCSVRSLPRDSVEHAASLRLLLPGACVGVGPDSLRMEFAIQFQFA